MKCKNCPFLLLCYMDRLGFSLPLINDKCARNYIFLCPSCEKLNYVYITKQADTAYSKVYAFFCEKRKVTQQIKNWITNTKFISGFVTDSITTADLLVVKCPKCVGNENTIPFVLNTSIDLIELE